MPKKKFSVNSRIAPDSRINAGTYTGTFHSAQINNVYDLNRHAIETLRSKFPQYDFLHGDIEDSYARNLLGSTYQNLKLENLAPFYNEDSHTINSLLTNISYLYGFLDNDTVSKIISDGKAKDVLETFTRDICENEKVLDVAPPDADITKGYLANKAVANMLGRTDLYADVDEVSIAQPDGSEKSGIVVRDDNLNQHIDSTQKGGESLQSKKALLDMQVFTLLTGQVAPNESSFTYTFDGNGDMSGLKMRGLGSEGSFVDNEVLISDKNSLPLITKSMYDKLSRLDVETYRDNLAKTGLNSEQLDNAVTNFLAMKDKMSRNVMIGNKDIYTTYNKEDGMVIVDDNVLEDLDLNDYPKLGFMKDYFEDSFNNNYIREREDMYQKPEVKADYVYTMDDATRNLATTIINHKRSFGFFSMSNSESYQKIVDELKGFEETGNPETLIRLCTEYEESHVNPRTNDGITRLNNISDLKHKLEIGMIDTKLKNNESKLNSAESIDDAENYKKEEITATYQKLQLLAKRNPEIDMESIKSFYDSTETKTAPSNVANSNTSSEIKQAAARIILHSMIKEELAKEEPDFKFINSLTQNANGVLRTISRSYAVKNLVPDEKDLSKYNPRTFLKTSSENIKSAKKESPTFSNTDSLLADAIINEGNIKQEKIQAEQEEAQRKAEREKTNAKEITKEQEATIERNLKDQKYLDSKPYFKDAAETNRKLTEANLKKYKERTGHEYTPKANDDFVK